MAKEFNNKLLEIKKSFPNPAFNYISVRNYLIGKLTSIGLEKRNDKPNTPDMKISAYTEKELADNTLMTFRVANHFPIMRELVSHTYDSFKKKLTSNTFGNICLLFYGNPELEYFRAHGEKSRAGNFSMSQNNTVVTVKDIFASYEIYKKPIHIPYHFYHFITDVLNNNDLDIIAETSMQWWNSNGDVSFNISDKLSTNAYYKHKENYVSSLDAIIKVEIVHKNGEIERLKEEVEVVVGSENPNLSYDLGSVKFVDSDDKRKNFTIKATLIITKCTDEQKDLLSIMFPSEETTSKKKRITESRSLSYEEKKLLYKTIMKKLAPIIKRIINNLD